MVKHFESMSVESYRQQIAQGQIAWPAKSKSGRYQQKRRPNAAPAIGSNEAIQGFNAQTGSNGPAGLDATTTAGRLKSNVRLAPEEDLQRLCWQLIQATTLQNPILGYLMHVPNGGARSKGEAGKLKAMGTRPGVPDFLLPRARGRWSGLAIELKSPTGRLSDPQKFWLAGLEQEGYLTSVCRSLDDFDALIRAFLNGAPAPSCRESGW